MKSNQIILFTLSLLTFSVIAETPIDQKEAAESFRNRFSPQHKMQNLLGSPKFDMIGTQHDTAADLLEDESESLPLSKKVQPHPEINVSEQAVTNSAAQLTLGEIQTFSGKVIKETWRKSNESYCQSGSDYYALIVAEQRYPLNSQRDPLFEVKPEDFHKLQAQLAKLEGQTITVRGQLATRQFTQQEHCPNQMMQCISGEIRCEWLRVTEIISQ